MTIPDSLSTAAKAFINGDLIIIVDSSLREDEADLALLAEKATPEKISFMIRHTGGVLCAPISKDIANKLDLPQMVDKNTEVNRTAFTVSIDYKFNTTSGISAKDRTLAAQALANPKSIPSDFNRPGHLFPLLAKCGGVLDRPGHTEASIDLCKICNTSPVAIISELIDDNGDLLRGESLIAFAKQYNIPILQVDTIIAYKKSMDKGSNTTNSTANKEMLC